MLTLKINNTLYFRADVHVYDGVDNILCIRKVAGLFISSSFFPITWANRLRCKDVNVAKCMEKSFYYLIVE